MSKRTPFLLILTVLAGACGGRDRTDPQAAADTAQRDTAWFADPVPADEVVLTPEELERGRLDMDWASVVTLDTTGAGVPVRSTERWEQISMEAVNGGPAVLPLAGDVAGPSVLRVQILLDRALFSPGMMDGRWGKNTAKAVFFFQQREGLPTTGRVDSATFARLAQVAGAPQELVRPHRLTEADVEGPFVEMPDSIYEIAELECTCYESLSEKLSERFHIHPDALARLNPDVDLDALQAGQTLNVPLVRDSTSRAGRVAELVVSGRGSYVHALDAQGRILYHFPSTLGATYDPSPQGDFRVTRVTRNPWWWYQPRLLANVPDDRPEATIPPGPNNRVGVVWMALSVPHYGIHGTHAPESIGYTSSAGCVRLTNWDASFLAGAVESGTPVRFRDIEGRTESGERAEARRSPPSSGSAASRSPARRDTTAGDTAGRQRRTPADSTR